MSFWSRNWWVALFCAVIAVACFHVFKAKKQVLFSLESRLCELEGERALVRMAREDLSLRIASQNDPAWIEMILIRDLGVVPEGFLKVHFKK